MGRRAVLLAGLALAAADPAPAQEPDIRVSLRPTTIALGETATLTVEMGGEGLSGFELSPDFRLENLEIVGGPYRSQSVSFTNGRLSRAESVSWRLAPIEEGRAAVSGIRVETGGRVVALPEREIEVRGRAAPPPSRRRTDPFGDVFEPFGDRGRPARAAPKVFLRAVATPTSPWRGQQVLYTVYLFSQADVVRIHPRTLPDFAGFWTHEVPQPENIEPEIVEIDGERFGRFALLQRVLFPLRDGELTIGPTEIALAIRVPERSFGILGSAFSRTEEIVRTTDGVTIGVRPLPDPPGDFDGAIGSLRVAAELEPAEVRAGEAVTYTVTLSGPGHLQGLAAPPAPDLDGVRVFPPRQEGHERVVGRTVQAMRSWSWVLVPGTAGRWEIPARRIGFFDPAEGRYATASAAPLSLTALPAAAKAAPEEATAAAGTAGTEPDPSPPDAQERSRYRGVGIVAVGAVLAIALLIAYRRRRSPAVQSFRADLRRVSAESDPRRAAARLEDAWREFLEQRWSIGPGRPSTEWPRLLVEAGARSSPAERLAGLAEELHYLRYAPQLSDAEALRDDLVSASRRLVRELR